MKRISVTNYIKNSPAPNSNFKCIYQINVPNFIIELHKINPQKSGYINEYLFTKVLDNSIIDINTIEDEILDYFNNMQERLFGYIIRREGEFDQIFSFIKTHFDQMNECINYYKSFINILQIKTYRKEVFVENDKIFGYIDFIINENIILDIKCTKIMNVSHKKQLECYKKLINLNHQMMIINLLQGKLLLLE